VGPFEGGGWSSVDPESSADPEGTADCAVAPTMGGGRSPVGDVTFCDPESDAAVGGLGCVTSFLLTPVSVRGSSFSLPAEKIGPFFAKVTIHLQTVKVRRNNFLLIHNLPFPRYAFLGWKLGASKVCASSWPEQHTVL
jgi:hypothetical protein